MTTSKSTAAKNGGRVRRSLDALAKQKRDALPEPTDYELFGVEFTLPPMRALEWELQEKVGDLNDTIGVMAEVLGPDKVKEMYAAGYQLGDLEVIALDWQEQSGLESGESRASTSS